MKGFTGDGGTKGLQYVIETYTGYNLHGHTVGAYGLRDWGSGARGD